MYDELGFLLSRLALAFGIGLLIGLERGWRTRDARPGSRTAGVRTFAIIGLLGGLVGLLARNEQHTLSMAGALLIGVSFITFALVYTQFGREENRAAQVFSATTTIAALLTFMLGVYAPLGNVHVAAAAAVTAAGVLMVREVLHGWVRKITVEEFESALVLMAMTFIALPVMPNRNLGSLGGINLSGINLREIWIIAIALAALSFIGFIAVRLLGQHRGILAASITGGVVSSTAVIFTNARDARNAPDNVLALAAGGALASAVSLVRVCVLVAALAPAVVREVVGPLMAGAIVALVLGLVVARQGVEAPVVAFRNPFRFLAVLGMAASMGAILVFGRFIHAQFGEVGAVLGAAITGSFDVDAMTVAMSRLVPDVLTTQIAGQAILIGVAANMIVKLCIGAVIGRGKFALLVAIVTAACIAAGAATWGLISALS